MPLPRYSRTFALAVVMAFAVAACGSDDGAGVRELGDGGDTGGSASGVVTDGAPIDPDATEDGGYEYASNVAAHRLVTLDVCEINTLLDADPIDFDAVGNLYRDGENSVNADGSVRSLGGFATSGNDGLAEFYGMDAPIDDVITAAIDGDGVFADGSDDVRRQAVQKGVQNQVLVAWMLHEFDEALEKAADGDFDADSGAPHNWDEAWAFYRGAAADCAPYATADKRAADFGTVTADGETGRTNEAILAAMIDGRDGLLAEDLTRAEDAVDTIRRNLVITYAQATLRYSTLAAADVEAGDTDAAEEHQIEGWAFFRVIEAIVAEVGADVTAINDILHPSNPAGERGDGDDVRSALQPALDAFSITDDDIGTLA